MTDGSNVSIDTKQDLQEVAGNVGRDHARFVREIERANAAGYRLVILVEQGGVTSIDDAARWVNRVCRACDRRRMGYCNPTHGMKCAVKRFKPMTGPTLARIMERLEERHGVRFEFCDKRSTARRICELLGVNYN